MRAYDHQEAVRRRDPQLERRWRRPTAWVREEMSRYQPTRPAGLPRRPAEARGAGGQDRGQAHRRGRRELSIAAAHDWFAELPTSSPQAERDRRRILREISERLGFLVDVGLDYLTLGRGSGTLSGGESQRIRLASQIGSGLTGVLYVLDEPSIGLHQRDNDRLLATLKRCATSATP